MKVIRKDEEFASSRKRKAHYAHHIDDNNNKEFTTQDFKSSERYEEAADKLAHANVNTSDLNSSDQIIGFIERRDDDVFIVKYNKQTKELVVYKPNSRMHSGNQIMTFYKADDQKYLNLFDKYYVDEVNL